MIRFTQLIAFIFISVVFLGCKKPTDPEQPSPPKQLEVVWKSKLAPEFSISGTNSLKPVLYGTNVIYYSGYNKKNRIGETLFFLDTASGTIATTWNDFSGSAYYEGSMANSEEYMLFGDQRRVDCLNLSTGSTQWKASVPSSWSIVYASNGYAYREFPSGWNGDLYERCDLKRTPLDSKSWETVYSFIRTDNFYPRFVGCGFGNLPNGDEVVVWKNWSQTPSNSYRTDVFAFNLTADTLMWRNTEMREIASVSQLKIVDDVIYGTLSKRLFAINLASGHLMWQQDFSQLGAYLVDSDPSFLVEGSYIYVQGAYKEIFQLRKSNGTVWKVITDLPQVGGDYTYFEGKLFGNGSQLSIIDIATGKDLLKGYDLKNTRTYNWPFPRSGITIDPLRRVFYCHDGYYAYCIKIPDL